MSTEIEIGDLVELRSGGPLMTVIGYQPAGILGSNKWICTWWNSDRHCGDTVILPGEALVVRKRASESPDRPMRLGGSYPTPISQAVAEGGPHGPPERSVE